MINYILQVIFFQVLFLAIYDFFLSKETFFTKNRWYLLLTPILSFVIPLIKIPTFQKAISQDYLIVFPEIVLNPDKVIQQSIEKYNFETSLNYIVVLFWVGVVFFTMLFFIRLMKIISLINKNTVIEKPDFKLIFLPKQTKAFSFFSYIFLGKDVPDNQQEKIIQHELVHAKQKHTLDLLFFETLKIIMWFNPILYFYQKRITLVHEYISDAKVAKLASKEQYINNLLSNFFQVENIAFVNQFFNKSQIKKRIIMMTKKQSKKMNQFKYLLLIPILISMVFYSACSEENIITKGNKISVKKQKIRYSQFGEGGINGQKTDKTSYLDVYFGTRAPKWIEISYDDLTFEESEEYEYYLNKINNSNNSFSNFVTLKVYQRKDGRRVVATIIDMEKFRKSKKLKNGAEDISEEVSFMKVDQAPTFPGCEEGDKACFSKKVQQHFAKNFNADMVKNLGLSSGRKRVYIGFKIDKTGNIIDIQARAPHKDIKDEVISVMQSLPKVKPGKVNNEEIAVKFSIPFTLNVE
ncbi:M56 family metallopeptidase [Polaribacter porphyrae]|uniref:BlaR1 peptidase M56 n=1 Tax=Polaribacter porphyrae TaxID=1137780 RepID=A0A2S7WP18_9FLAO|nr:M56 family metallopeptidase [Polaribacter porphyrae]PQJ79333.1 BlaR1 peptidase M56 [Polaribacter porphyrae]